MTTATIPSTTGLLAEGDLFSQTTGLTIFRVEQVSDDPQDNHTLWLTVTTWMGEDRGTQVLPFTYDHPVTRWV